MIRFILIHDYTKEGHSAELDQGPIIPKLLSVKPLDPSNLTIGGRRNSLGTPRWDDGVTTSSLFFIF
jgi:hypothetical protein